jgi:oligosaccharide translocation protein RFT1
MPIRDTTSQSVVETVATGYAALFIAQLFSRGLSFFSNLAVARLAQRDAYGVASVLQICFCDLILNIGREGFRDACQRTSPARWQDPAGRAQILRVAWFSLPLSILIGIFLSTFPYALGLEDIKYSGMASYRQAVTLYIVASVLEVLSEPLYILAQNLLLLRLRSRIDMASLFFRVTTILTCLILFPAAPLRAFALGQFASSVTILTSYVTYFCIVPDGLGVRETCCVLLGRGGGAAAAGGLDWSLVRMVCTMCGKNIQKLVLEKGETLVPPHFSHARLHWPARAGPSSN